MSVNVKTDNICSKWLRDIMSCKWKGADEYISTGFCDQKS